ncbi:hypothetical protein [Rhizobium leguminosarum]|uniref:hypothetical protein n=1 Tax=Rhizobium leguminosarum TaxID=384 RepID=UPI0004253729|nr:hypothetical protein [Rhizobium leguminosarum]
MNAPVNSETRMPALMVGGSVNAIIPQSIEEMWRVAKMVVVGGLAPKALVGKKAGDEAISSVAIAIMAGAELGLPPMVALRSFTVIGGRPALYGDGIINVARRSRKAANISTGYMASATNKAMLELGVPKWKIDLLETSDERSFGWCKAKRSDTGEEKIEIFSIADAKRAALWDERPTVKKQDWNTKAWSDVPNESPWFRYPQRMCAWRAAGYNLRELFADVLGGITDEFEAREIAGEFGMRDITPPAESVEAKPTPPKPPKPPAPPSAKTIDADPVPEQPAGESEFALGDYLDEIETALAGAKDEADVEEIWNDFDAPAVLETEGHDDMIEAAFAIKTRRLAQLSTLNGG